MVYGTLPKAYCRIDYVLDRLRSLEKVEYAICQCFGTLISEGRYWKFTYMAVWQLQILWLSLGWEDSLSLRNSHTTLCTSRGHPQILLVLELTVYCLLNQLDSELLAKRECVVFFSISSMESTRISKQELWLMWFKQTEQSSPTDSSNFHQYQLPGGH